MLPAMLRSTPLPARRSPSARPMVRRRTFPQHGRFINKQKGWPDQPDRWAASLIQTALSLTDAEAAPQIPRL